MEIGLFSPGIITFLIIGAAILSMIVKIIPEYERAVVFRLGRVISTPRGPGVIFLIPAVEKMVRMSIRTITMDVEPQDVITRDNISLKVNAVIYFRVVDPIRAIVNVENYLYATSQLAQTHLRSTLGEHSMDELLTERERINNKLQLILDQNTEPWGIKIVSVEVKHVDLPPDMQRAMAKQAEAERERRAKIINAEGELQASKMLADAASTLATSPLTMQLRYLQTIQGLAAEKTSTIIFPLPIELLKAFTDHRSNK